MPRTFNDLGPTRRCRPKETLEDMSEHMAAALVFCATQGAPPQNFGTRAELQDKTSKVRWTNTTRDALEAHDLIHLAQTKKGRPLWRATDTGRGVVAAHAPRLLMPAARPRRVDADGSCYTHIPAFSMRHEPEVA
jgi:hypothetical protein